MRLRYEKGDVVEVLAGCAYTGEVATVVADENGAGNVVVQLHDGLFVILANHEIRPSQQRLHLV